MELVGHEALKAIPYRLSEREHRQKSLVWQTLSLMDEIHVNGPTIDGFGIAYQV